MSKDSQKTHVESTEKSIGKTHESTTFGSVLGSASLKDMNDLHKGNKTNLPSGFPDASSLLGHNSDAAKPGADSLAQQHPHANKPASEQSMHGNKPADSPFTHKPDSANKPADGQPLHGNKPTDSANHPKPDNAHKPSDEHLSQNARPNKPQESDSLSKDNSKGQGMGKKSAESKDFIIVHPDGTIERRPHKYPSDAPPPPPPPTPEGAIK